MVKSKLAATLGCLTLMTTVVVLPSQAVWSQASTTDAESVNAESVNADSVATVLTVPQPTEPQPQAVPLNQFAGVDCPSMRGAQTAIASTLNYLSTSYENVWNGHRELAIQSAREAQEQINAALVYRRCN